jgi:hypothetical protein
MFANKECQLRPDAERITERAANLSNEEVARLEERQAILKDVLNSFDARLQSLPERERKAILCLLYKEIATKVFDFRLSVETRLARKAIKHAPSVGVKMAALKAFQLIMADVATLHGE